MKQIIFCLLLALNLAFTGCATNRVAGWDKNGLMVELSKKEARSLNKVAEKNWKKRDSKEHLEKSLVAYEKLANGLKDNYHALVMLCRGNYLLADGHYDDMKMKMSIWEKGTSYGEKAMATNPGFAKKITEVEGKVEEALDTLNKGQIEAIYWTAVNLGKWGKAAGIVTILKYKSRIKKMINKVGELDKNFFHGAFDRYWGAYYAIAPGFAGGDIKKSLVSFKKSIDRQKNYLGTYVLMAEYYATKKGDKALFKKQLDHVLNADAGKLKVVMPENKIEKKKAKKLLAKMEDLF